MQTSTAPEPTIEHTPARTSSPRQAATSLFRYSPGLVLIAIAVADSIRSADPDLWGHIRFGQAVLSQGHLVLHDLYSYSVPGHLWLNHEWLTEVIMAAVFNHAGVIGLKLMKFACAAATVILLAGAIVETGAPTPIQFGILISVSVTISPGFQFRPQIFTLMLLAALLYIFARDAYRGAGRLWLAIPIMALWANLHGGFIVGIASLGIYSAVSGAQNIFAGRGWGRAFNLAAITIAATAATLATPYGVGTWRAVAHALHNPYTRLTVDDWQPLLHAFALGWHGKISLLNYELGILLVAALLFSSILTLEAADLPLVAIAAVTSVAAFVSVRNLPIAAIALATPLARHLSLAMARRWPAVAPGAEGPVRSPWISQMALAYVAILLSANGGLYSNYLTAREPYPVGACNFMKQHGLRGNILDNFAWGEYLIWHLEPDSKVFIDGRYDTVYPYDVLHQFLIFNYNRPGGDQILKDYPNDFILLPPDVAANKLLAGRTNWKLIYQDDGAMLYARAGSPAAQIPGVPIVARVAPASSFP